MADEAEIWTGEGQNWAIEDDWSNENAENLYDPALHYVNPKAYSRWPLDRFVAAAHDGDLELLAKMLDRENPIDGYHGDINVHCPTINALQAAAVNGQLEAVEMLLKAKADPHVKATVPYGKDPQDGETARDLADKWGWEDISAVLKQAEQETFKGVYRPYGTGNNAKLWPIDRPMGLDPVQERRAVKKYKGLVRPVPNRADRKFYGDAVYGITHGYDDDGKPIRGKKDTVSVEAPTVEIEVGEPWTVAPPSAPAPKAAAKVGLLFPGQGSQYVRMMEEVKFKPGVQRMLSLAKDVLDFDVLEACLQGPESLLEQPHILLPAMYVADLAGMEKLRAQRPDVADHPGAVAGMFVGEYAALATAGVFSFTLGLSLVKACGDLVRDAAATGDQATASVAGLDKATLQSFCEQARTKRGGVCQIANELFPKGFTCAGDAKTVEELKSLVDAGGALQCKLIRTFGAVHTPLMEPARAKMEAKLREALPSLRPPRCDVYLNSTGKALRKGTDPKDVIEPVAASLASAVLWEKCVIGMVDMGIDEFYEVGPGNQLKAMMKRIDPTSWGRTKGLDI